MKKTLLGMVLAVGLISCNKMEPVVEIMTNNMVNSTSDIEDRTKVGTVKVANGWLHFGTMEDFKAVMKILHDEIGIDGLDQWEKEKRGFLSLRSAYGSLEAENSDNLLSEEPASQVIDEQLMECPDSHFATVLNNVGRIQIADTLYQFFPGKENGEGFAIPERYISSVLSGEDWQHLSGVVVFPTSLIRTPFPRWEDNAKVKIDPSIHFGICNFPNQLMPNWWGQKGGDINGDDNGFTLKQDNGRPVKLNYHRWRVNYKFYSSVGVRVKMWKHTRFGGWMSTVNFNSASMEACVKGIVVNHTLIPIPFNTKISPAIFAHNTNNFEKTLMWIADPIFSNIILEHFNFQFRVNYQGQVMERYIRE